MFIRTHPRRAAGAIGTDFLDRISRGRIGEPRIGACAPNRMFEQLRNSRGSPGELA
jgi:hypothetical protein